MHPYIAARGTAALEETLTSVREWLSRNNNVEYWYGIERRLIDDLRLVAPHIHLSQRVQLEAKRVGLHAIREAVPVSMMASAFAYMANLGLQDYFSPQQSPLTDGINIAGRVAIAMVARNAGEQLLRDATEQYMLKLEGRRRAHLTLDERGASDIRDARNPWQQDHD
jgi:hypothetical protein